MESLYSTHSEKPRHATVVCSYLPKGNRFRRLLNRHTFYPHNFNYRKNAMVKQVELLTELYRDVPRQGPGSDQATEMAFDLTGIDRTRHLNILDIGCGTGAQSMKLASMLPNSNVFALDRSKIFLEELRMRRDAAGIQNIETVTGDMEDLPVEREAVDLIWSEGAAYLMGFKKALYYWNQFLKYDGYMVVSDLSWLSSNRPAELTQYWNTEYPEMSTISEKIKAIEDAGYTSLGHFTLPETAWMENYYDPLIEQSKMFLGNFSRQRRSVEIVHDLFREINVFRKYSSYFSYVFYVMKKTDNR